MPKISNWSKINEKTWKNDKTSHRIKIADLRKSGGGFMVTLEKNGEHKGRIALEGTKEDARQEAVKWMRSHPLPSR